jgi:hypothetical protein
MHITFGSLIFLLLVFIALIVNIFVAFYGYMRAIS